MNVLANITPGILSIAGRDITGLTLVLAHSGKGRLAHPRLQLVRATGGFGCNPASLGSGVFVDPLFVEAPRGSGKLCAPAEGEDHGWKARREEFLGEASPELIEWVLAGTTTTVDAIDPGNCCVMAIGEGMWAKGDTVREALKGLGKRTIGKTMVAVVHRECSINDFGQLVTPKAALLEGVESVGWVFNGDGRAPSIDNAEGAAAAHLKLRKTVAATLAA